MFSKSYSAALEGISASIVQVEADVSNGLPCFELVGLLGTEVREASSRVRVALRNSDFILPPKRITVNLSPADLRKEGTAFDLAIAISILTASGHIPQEALENIMFIGELNLNGRIHKVNGILPIVAAAKEQGFFRCVVPCGNATEGALVSGIEVIGVSTLKEVVLYLLGSIPLYKTLVDLPDIIRRERKSSDTLDYADIIGQACAKRAIEIAVAGYHNILMIGPPGSGKTMLAKRIPSIMPDMSIDESLLLTKIYSVAGELKEQQSVVLNRPFRAPHHTITQTALVGGGKHPKPGEISIASYGVLFLDELPEYPRGTLELLRQPLEERYVTINRLHQSISYPANFMLVAAMNPCNCGYYPDTSKCSCNSNQVKKYLGRISGPLLDRIDIMVETALPVVNDFCNTKQEENSDTIRNRIIKAQERQMHRYQNETFHYNSDLTPNTIKTYCKLGRDEENFLTTMFTKLHLSMRAYHRMLKVARTIADLEGTINITTRHLSEAICYRSLDLKYWGGED